MAKITVVGLGPGDAEDMTPRAVAAIRQAAVVAGYHTYIRLIPEFVAGKRVLGTGMMQEIERCQLAVAAAAAGEDTVVVSSGDAGIYGMAGLVLELLLARPQNERPVWGGVVAGISAVNAAASLLGAPLMHDFAVISLSDLLTPWATIEKRVELAAAGDFVLALYNPKSRRRVQQIERVRDLVLQHRALTTPVGIVTNAGRAGEQKTVTTLDAFTQAEIGMTSLVIIGNSQTYVREGFMLTPRGYAQKAAMQTSQQA